MKKLLIVCEDNLIQYGDFLSQLISLEDDKEGEIVGIKDGSVAAQVWPEKDYKANAAKISSDQYILFVGNSKLAKDKRAHMLNKYSKYGMNYWCLGKQASLFVDAAIDASQYDSFIEEAQLYNSDIKHLFGSKTEQLALPAVDDPQEEAAGFVVIVPEIVQKAKARGAEALRMAMNNKKILDQQYTCLMCMFYLNGLNTFLGLGENR